MMGLHLKTIGIAGGCGIAAGLALGLWMRNPESVVETYTPEIRQKDGSVQAEKRSDPKAKPKHVIPKGSKVERIGSVVVTLPTSGSDPKTGEAPASVTVDTTIVRQADGTSNLIYSSPDGTITGAVDIPVSAEPLKLPKWTATALIGWDVNKGKVYGAMVSRRSGPLVVQGGFIGDTAFAGVGFTW